MNPRPGAPALFPASVRHVCARRRLVARSIDYPARRRAELRLGRYCVRSALAALPDAGDLPAARAPDGAPRWPTGVVGSITHCDGYVAAAVASAREVLALGVDSDYRRTLDAADHLADTVAHDDELEAIRDVTSGDRALGILLIASAKESLFKALYPLVQRWFDFDAVRLGPWTGATFVATLDVSLAAGWSAGQTFAGAFVVEEHLVHTGCAVLA